MNIENNNPVLGPGGAPTRATTLPTDAKERKKYPISSGVLEYFPDAIAAIANLSYIGNEQHQPGQSLRWDRSKSGDEADTMMRHFLQRGTLDTDGMRHTVKMAWRALAILQKEIEAEKIETAGTVAPTLYRYFLTDGCYVYRARFSDNLGEWWDGKCWCKSTVQPPIARYHRAALITAEQAKARGAQI